VLSADLSGKIAQPCRSVPLAKSVVYHKVILDEVAAREVDPQQPLRAVDLPLQYRKDAGHLAQRRVSEAGFRLAEIFRQAGENPKGE
jgi:hypothetical protein